jgi:cyclohexanone monooxygenase
MDYRVMQRMRDRVDAIVEDKETAERLKPWFRFLCKRPLSNDEYYPTFNRPGVKLIDVSATQGLEAMTEKGFLHNGEEIEVDCMIFASGFEVTSDLERRWGIPVIAGQNGQSLYDHWRDGPLTLHGTMTSGFPNQFFMGFIQGGVSANTTAMFEQQAKHIAYLIAEAQNRGATTVEPSQEAQDAWVHTVRELAIDNSAFELSCTPGYYNNEGREPGPAARLNVGHPAGATAYFRYIDAWRSTGEFEGLQFR